ncbi:MAG TPA: hypothetical protein VHV08_08015 [Pirellulales bacterium]|nr:hypothetical protein [Pirellulales bacterium]
MTFFDQIIWDLPDDPRGNVLQIAAHHVAREEVEQVLCDPRSTTELSRASGKELTLGRTMAGRRLAVVREKVS